MIRVPTASTSTSSDDDTSSQIQDQSIILRDSSNSNSGSSISSTNFNDNDNNGNEINNNDDNIDDDVTNKIYDQSIQFEQVDTFESELAQSSLLIWAAYENHKEIVLGSCAAISVFLTVILVFIVNRRKSRQTVDKAPLVDNEASINVDVERLTIHV